MKENVGRRDRIVRAFVGPALLGLGYARWGGNEGNLTGLAAIMAGVAVIESAITRVCLVNRILGIDTRSAKEKAHDLRGTVELDVGYAVSQTRMRSQAQASPP